MAEKKEKKARERNPFQVAASNLAKLREAREKLSERRARLSSELTRLHEEWEAANAEYDAALKAFMEAK